MKRSPIVLAGTAAGLVGVLGFHSTPAKITLATVVPPAHTRGTQAPSTGVRTAVGAQVNYYYGVLSVKVSIIGKRITSVSLATLNDGGNSYSQYVDQQSIPVLKRQALVTQSAKIQGVSGASYTTEGFTQSLQSALSQLGQ